MHDEDDQYPDIDVDAFVKGVRERMDMLNARVGRILDYYALAVPDAPRLEEILGKIGTEITRSTSEPLRVEVKVTSMTPCGREE